MENRINIAKLLKNSPRGMELDCTMFNENVKVVFDMVEGFGENLIIKIIAIHNNNRNVHILTEYGQWNTLDYAKCIIFPKGKSSWEGFIPHQMFKDGDIIFTHAHNLKMGSNTWISIFKENSVKGVVTYAGIKLSGEGYYDNTDELCSHDDIINQRLATEEEKERLFKVIEEHGYKWNSKAKTLEPIQKFKIGNWVVDDCSDVWNIKGILNQFYLLECVEGGESRPTIDWVDKTFHLWTIQDAKDGDIIFTQCKSGNIWISIFKKKMRFSGEVKTYVDYHSNTNDDNIDHCYVNTYGVSLCTEEDIVIQRPATEGEKKKLLKAIEDKGYRWNAVNKSLEKLPKFKIGDRIRNKTDKYLADRTIASYVEGIGYFTTINDWVRINEQDNWELVITPSFEYGDVIENKNTHTSLKIISVKSDEYIVEDVKGSCFILTFNKQDEWKLVKKEKFDISKLKAFESKVLVRDSIEDVWRPAIFGAVVKKGNEMDMSFVVVGGGFFEQCIPYMENEHLLGTTNDCGGHYKSWIPTPSEN
jgi:hypothetical protein